MKLKKLGLMSLIGMVLLVTGCGEDNKIETKEMNNYQLDLRVYVDDIRESVRVNVNDDDLYITKSNLEEEEEYYVIDGKSYALDGDTYKSVNSVEYENSNEFLNKVKNLSWEKSNAEKIGETTYKVYTFRMKASEIKSLVKNIKVEGNQFDGKVYIDSNNYVYKIVLNLGDNDKIDATFFRIGMINKIELPRMNNIDKELDM